MTGTHHHACQETMANCLRKVEKNDGKISVHMRSIGGSILPDADVKCKRENKKE